MSVQVSQAALEHSGAGAAIERWTLSGGQIEVSVLSLGATLHTIRVPDRTGRLSQVLLCSERLEEILGPARHFGATVGRYANRIADSRITLDGQEHELAPTGHGVTLHGGPEGFADRLWTGEPVTDGDRAGVRMRLHSTDGDQGFPGALDVEVSYLLDPGGELAIEYRAVTTRPTVINVTNHAYVNLAGEGQGDVLDHLLTLEADHYTPTDARQVPTGEIQPVAGTPFDFRTARPIGEQLADEHPQLVLAGGYDHNWVLRSPSKDGRPARAAVLEDPLSGRRLEVLTSEPGIQVYTANGFAGEVTGPSGTAYGPRAGVALETQHFPDSPHHPGFPTTELCPGEEFRSVTLLRFSW
jgi:aldose 1-epimerase